MMKCKIFFFGRFPAYKEVGGVTTFTYNFSLKYNSEDLTVIDFYPAVGKKVPKGVNWVSIRGGWLVRLIKKYLFFRKNDGVYFFNYSTIRSMLLLFFMPKPSGTRWVAVFHNGEQAKVYRDMDFFQKYIVRKCIKKVNVVGCLSDKQYDFFGSMGAKIICRVSPYIPVNVTSRHSKNRRPGKPLLRILISGFPTQIYRHLETILMLERLSNAGHELELHVCLYGFDDEGLRESIVSRVEALPFAYLHEHIDAVEFNVLLNRIDLYLRMNSVDSFGLVVAEAIDKGIKVIATDVCERYPGTFLVEKDDFDRVYSELKNFLTRGCFSEQLNVQKTSESIIEYDELLSIVMK